MALQSSVDATVESDRVVFEYTVENVGDAPEEVQFRSSLLADFAVVADGEEVWRASDDQMFAQMIQTERIDADDGETFAEAWDDPAPGDYTVVATLNATGDDAEARTDFSV
ncbi:BsuPI-related putative proteinase inhibitor [Halorussus limi]|uniref:Intracellular proteinase inhibitor BsuPI domain-containing protein n=1 Tax=Halorussus limi TaxID=2938695 RepID=A0A8U0HTU7_9EURY|nr:BsuPI-related putative proteinase inhibitor [Halorussus limi]UPV74126.1 BsuPI-related putative proteinase inhibitor [Halorussus limi]